MSLEPDDGFRPNFMYCIIRVVENILVTLTQFSRSTQYQDCKNEPGCEDIVFLWKRCFNFDCFFIP